MLICCFTLAISVEAQFTMKADLYKQRERVDTTMEFPSWSIAQKDSTIIIFNEDSTLFIDNEYNTTYKINSILLWSNGVDDGESDRWIGFMALSTDSNGIVVKMTVMRYESGTILVAILYGGLEFRYQGRKYKKVYPFTI